ncbi:hypothetical protein P3T34_001053 [Kitasatospora sp. MAP12-44]|nr:hypothetical protein [Kitasatospora sp. MAP12-44]
MSLTDPPPHRGLTIHTYRITSNGQRVELAKAEYGPEIPCGRPFSGTWPVCQCPRCMRKLSEDASEDVA